MADIEINIDWDKGTLSWDCHDLSGKQALWLMSDTIINMYGHFFNDPMRPAFNPQPARVCIELESDKLAIAFRPEGDLAAAKALTAAALVALAEKSGKESVNSFEVMFGAIVRNTQETLGGERILDKLRGG